MLQELSGGAPAGLLEGLVLRELARAVYADKELELAGGGLNLGEVDMEEPDGLALELLPFRLVAADIGQPRGAMPLLAVQRLAREGLDNSLKRIEAIIQWQQRGSARRRRSWPPGPLPKRSSVAF